MCEHCTTGPLSFPHPSLFDPGPSRDASCPERDRTSPPPSLPCHDLASWSPPNIPTFLYEVLSRQDPYSRDHIYDAYSCIISQSLPAIFPRSLPQPIHEKVAFDHLPPLFFSYRKKTFHLPFPSCLYSSHMVGAHPRIHGCEKFSSLSPFSWLWLGGRFCSPTLWCGTLFTNPIPCFCVGLSVFSRWFPPCDAILLSPPELFCQTRFHQSPSPSPSPHFSVDDPWNHCPPLYYFTRTFTRYCGLSPRYHRIFFRPDFP